MVALQPFFQLVGALIATLLVALVVTVRFLIRPQVETAAGWLVAFRRTMALAGLAAAV